MPRLVPFPTERTHENIASPPVTRALEVLHGPAARAARAGHARARPGEHPGLRAFARRAVEGRPDVRRPGRVPGAARRRAGRRDDDAGGAGVRDADRRSRRRSRSAGRAPTTSASAGAAGSAGQGRGRRSERRRVAVRDRRRAAGGGVARRGAADLQRRRGAARAGRRAGAPRRHRPAWSRAACRWGCAWPIATAPRWSSWTSGWRTCTPSTPAACWRACRAAPQRRCRVVAGTATLDRRHREAGADGGRGERDAVAVHAEPVPERARPAGGAAGPAPRRASSRARQREVSAGRGAQTTRVGSLDSAREPP